jgi:phosphoglycerol transferase MdoB-like AlkP superfamily enzyme
VQKYLNIKIPDKKLPLLRKIDFDSTNVVKYNVVLVIMESMSAAKMERHGNTNNLTPFLDSISKKGYYFENAYTAGIHTMNGIFSTFFSFPALFRQNPMKESSILKYHGVFSTLKDNGYSTIYFTTHDGQFDNVEGFLKANECETVISKPNYPSDKVKTTLGVPDDFMFEFSIPILNKLNQENKPFFAALMTASDHGPYYIPEYFKPRNSEIKKQIVEYADYSLEKFIDLSSKQKWFKNTIFVFVADHGAPLDGLYDMSIDFFHTPLIFYAPNIFKEYKINSNIAGQIDVFPTIMGLLKLQYNNNTLGIDLLKESRPYIFFNADDKYGVIDTDWFLIVRDDKIKSLYKYRNSDTHNYAGERPDIVEKMNVYAQSNLQTFQYIIRSNKQ